LNVYGYAGGDPVNFSDPFGLSPCEDYENEDERAECEELEAERAAEREMLSKRCDADVLQLTVNAALHVAAVGTMGSSFALGLGLRAGVTTLDDAYRFAYGFALGVPADGAVFATGLTAGTPNPFSHPLMRATYGGASVIPGISLLKDGGEAVVSCAASITGG
jgi:hypothetical protein